MVTWGTAIRRRRIRGADSVYWLHGHSQYVDAFFIVENSGNKCSQYAGISILSLQRLEHIVQKRLVGSKPIFRHDRIIKHIRTGCDSCV